MGDFDHSDTPREIIWQMIQSIKVFLLESCHENEAYRAKLEADFALIEQVIDNLPGKDITAILYNMSTNAPEASKVIDTLYENLIITD